MFGFFFKKNACDVWDNLLHCILLNLIAIVLVLGSVFLCMWTLALQGRAESYVYIFFYVALILCCMILNVFFFAEGENAAKVANFETPSYSRYFKNILPSIKDGFLFGFFQGILISVALVSMPYYYHLYRPADGSQGSIFYLLCMVFVFWFLLITALSMQWFIAVRSLMHNNFWKCVKKSYILFFDNMGFTLGMTFVNILNLALTILTFGLVPGITGITFTSCNALRLRLYKYDWLEVNPDLSPKEQRQVPWKDLLAKDKKTLGPRKLKNIFKPWKDEK